MRLVRLWVGASLTVFLPGSRLCWAIEPVTPTASTAPAVIATPDSPPPLERAVPRRSLSPLSGRIIVLDPGHATKNYSDKIINPGAHARRGVEERDVVLSVADKLVPLLEAQGARVYVTRTRGNPWRYTAQSRQADNRSRAIFANTLRADVYVRLHCDWNRSRHFKGHTTYYYRWGSRRLAKALRRALAEALPGHTDHGIHRRTFVSVSTTMPTVLLELGVLSNRKEGKELANEGFHSRLAEAVSTGLVNYFEESPKRRKSALLSPQASVIQSTTTVER